MATAPDVLLLVGRVILGAYFLFSAYSHLVKGKALIGYAQMKGVRAPTAAVYGSGLLLLAGGLSLVLGLYPVVGLALLAAFLVGVTPKMHAFWSVKDPMQRMGEQINFTKNVALLGALLALFAVATPWAWSVQL